MADCLFCSIIAGTTPAQLVLDTPDVVGFLDIRPVFKGHTLIVPRTHVPTLVELPDDMMVPFFGAARSVASAVRTAFDAQGSFVAVNNVVSQSVPHLHVHVVPRTKGDGLRGFFWPRTKYADTAEAEEYAGKLRAALED
jgi:histidine triad (HIT) family protein